VVGESKEEIATTKVKIGDGEVEISGFDMPSTCTREEEKRAETPLKQGGVLLQSSSASQPARFKLQPFRNHGNLTLSNNTSFVGDYDSKSSSSTKFTSFFTKNAWKLQNKSITTSPSPTSPFTTNLLPPSRQDHFVLEPSLQILSKPQSKRPTVSTSTLYFQRIAR